jgi:predicted O-methyltransferase YrrM
MDAPFPAGLMDEIERFFKGEDERMPGLDLYQDVFDSPLFFPLQRRHEMAKMMAAAREIEPTAVMEIGSDKGGSLYHWCKCLPSVKNVIACEVRGTPYAELFEHAFPHVDFLWLPMSSYDHEVVRTVGGWLGKVKIDCLFIDGDKGAFLRDFDAYRSLVSDDGLVFMHDIVDDIQCSQDYDEVRRRGYGGFKIVDMTDGEEGERQRERGEKPATAYWGFIQYWQRSSMGVGVVEMKKGLR